MQFTSETSSNGVIERSFILDEITGVLWSPASASVGAPLLLLGHAGGMHKKAPGLVASALHCATNFGFTVVAIDAPGHGDRPRNRQDQQWAETIHQARAAGQPIASIVIDYNMSLAETAVAGMAGAPGRPEGAAPDGRRSGDRLRQRDAGRRGRAGVDGLPAAGRAWGRCEKCFRQTCFGPPQTAERRYGPRGTSRLTPHGPAGVRRPGIQRGRTRLSARRMCSRSF